MSTSPRRTRRARPRPERLEGRSLLNGDFRYRTPEGAAVHVQLLGPGDLKGTRVLPDGSLDLRFEGTAASSRIYGFVAGGPGRARLADLRDSKATPGDFTGAGTEAVGIVKLKSFDLVPGGVINLTAGFSRLILGSTGPNSQVQLRATNATTVSNRSNNNTNSSVGTGVSGGSSTAQSSGITSTLTSTGSGSVGGLGSGATAASSSGFGSAGAGGANVSGIPGTIVGTNVGGITSTVVTGTGSATGGSGGTNSSGSPAGTVTGSLAGAGTGTITNTGTGTTVISSQTTTGGSAGTRPGITAAVVIIDHVEGAPHAGPALGGPQIFGYDPTANALIRFNARTGAALQTIPLAGTGTGTAVAGVALGRDAGQLVALVGFGTSIRAFDAATGAPAGEFRTASLAKNGLKTVDGIGSTNTTTVFSDSSAGTLGLLQEIDVTKSLATGQAVAIGAAYAPTREFELSGGLTGLAGTDTIYATGAAHFDTFQPDRTQAGLLALNAAGAGPLAETARAALSGPPGGPDAGPAGTARKTPTNALGSVEGDLALVTGVVNGKNTVNLFSAGVTPDGILPLNDPNRLAGLSESFHPELAGSSLVNVQGVLRRFNAQDARGLVLNVSGRVDLVLIPGPVSDSAIVGRPAAHVATGPRSNVTILSTPRINGTKGGVITDETPRPLGPLALP